MIDIVCFHIDDIGRPIIVFIPQECKVSKVLHKYYMQYPPPLPTTPTHQILHACHVLPVQIRDRA